MREDHVGIGEIGVEEARGQELHLAPQDLSGLVRAGDRLGTVDVLGVREDVVAPVDGVVGLSLAEAGEAVEYGQELVRIELPENSRGLAANGADREAAAVLGEA